MVLEIIKFLFLEMRKSEANLAKTGNTARDILNWNF